MPGELFKANVETLENGFMPVIISETGLISYLISGAFYVVILYLIKLAIEQARVCILNLSPDTGNFSLNNRFV